MRYTVFALLAMLNNISTAYGSAWTDQLRSPYTHELCCPLNDCRFATVRHRNGWPEAFVGGHWVSVPDTTILQNTKHPTGLAIVSTLRGQITCFVDGASQ